MVIESEVVKQQHQKCKLSVKVIARRFSIPLAVSQDWRVSTSGILLVLSTLYTILFETGIMVLVCLDFFILDRYTVICRL